MAAPKKSGKSWTKRGVSKSGNQSLRLLLDLAKLEKHIKSAEDNMKGREGSMYQAWGYPIIALAFLSLAAMYKMKS